MNGKKHSALLRAFLSFSKFLHLKSKFSPQHRNLKHPQCARDFLLPQKCSWFLLYDNVPAQTDMIGQRFLVYRSMQICQPPYSPDFTPPEFFSVS
jgi:hypothetical protein